jgi:hypothetical protein
MREKKVLFTVVVDNYAPALTELTFPWLRHYASKIGADFHIISDRKSPHLPPAMEKLQIYDLGKDNDWNVYIDADALINPDLMDVTSLLHKDTVLFTGKDMAAMRFRPTGYEKRDGRYIGACNWFCAASDWCIDLWYPLDLTREEAINNIFPVCSEKMSGIIDPAHLMDDYTLSRNIARFGLKHLTIEQDLKPKFNRPYDNYYWHQYTMPIETKVQKMLEILVLWGMILPEVDEKYHDYIEAIKAQQAAQRLQPFAPQSGMMLPPGLQQIPVGVM